MNDIKVGEFIRTKKGYIDRIKCYISETEIYYCKNGAIIDPKNELANYLTDIKHSENIIDLIEVGDYVNGREVKHIADFEGVEHPIRKVILVDEHYLLPGESLENEEIKSIVTHEQFNSIKYVLGGKEE